MGRYLFDVDKIEEDLVILMSIFNSSKENHALIGEYVEKGFLYAIFYREWNIIEDKIISTAIKLRAMDDRFITCKKSYQVPFSNVGTLREGDTNKCLEFREASNKIVHALEFSPKTEVNEKYTSYVPVILLKGNRGKVNWTAELEMSKYIVCGLSLLKEYSDDWDISSRID